MHRPPFAALTALAALLLTLPGLAGAQSLKDLYEAARGYDATYLSARALADSAQYKAEQVDALGRPRVGLAASSYRSRVYLPQNYGSGDQSSSSANVNGRYPIYNQSNKAAIEQGGKSLAMAQADLEAAEQDLIVRVAQAYFDVLASRDALETTRASKAAITEQLASAKRNFEVGTATITDTREAQARYDLARAQEIQAENDLRTKRIALQSLVGKADVEPRPLAQPVTLPAIAPADPESWVTTADGVHPSIRKARLAYEVAQLETEKARAGGKPTLDAVASAGVSNSSGTGVLTSIPGSTKTATVGLEFNWPLYAGGSIQNRIKETLSLEDKARNDLQGALRAVEQGTRVAYFDLQSGMAQVQALEAAESSSKLALEATQLGYKVGVRVNIDVLNSQTQLYTTERDLAKARYDVIVGGLKLRRAAGALGQGDVEAANRLLAK
ncbi:MAG: TolC family outer membrane protein [Burkholderiales bacterium]|nr:TolC family outer membrane protein [Burkholderiales bacterium]